MPRNEDRRDEVHKLDDFDRRIIAQLQEDGRRSYTELARSIGMSEAGVRQRVRRLRDAQVMDIVAVTDPLKMGFRMMAMVGLRLSGDVQRVAEALGNIPEVEYVVVTAGSYDLLVEVVCQDEQHLLSLLNKQIRAIPGVLTTESFIYLQINKQSFAWARL
jgi:Lrp/AsnC family transcriptional regulator, regulator for asnA, asnC and gidA